MNTMPVLTIAIPTYNRADDLRRLLGVLAQELGEIDDSIDIVICDNASTDHTREVIERFVEQTPAARAIHQATNLGMDGNFCACAESVRGEYFWLIGDDDLPVPGAIQALVSLLKREKPDLLYMDSRWLPDVSIAAKEPVVGPLRVSDLSQEAFGRRVHVWTTFLSAMIVRRTNLLDDSRSLRAFYGTHLTQMAWIMERLREGSRFLHVRTPCVLATAGNTGGYAAIKVFGEHFPRIVRESLSRSPRQRRLARAIVLRSVLLYLPNLLWSLRLARAGNFESENVEVALRPQLGSHPLTSLLLLPVSRAPVPIAKLVLKLGQAAGRMLAAIDRIRLKAFGGESFI